MDRLLSRSSRSFTLCIITNLDLTPSTSPAPSQPSNALLSEQRGRGIGLTSNRIVSAQLPPPAERSTRLFNFESRHYAF